jgi:hypothetical protein
MAERNGFEVLVTGDQSIEYQQDLTNRAIAIIVLTRYNWPQVKPHIARIASAIDSASRGSYRVIDCTVIQKN